MTESVKVMVRCRPMNQKQRERECKNIIVVDKSMHQIGLKKISNLSTTIKNFSYDHVFDGDVSQEQVYQQSAFSLVQNVLNGYNGTIFAYGQTGCGKTHTMLGINSSLSTKKSHLNNSNNQTVKVKSLKLQNETMGIIPRAFRQIMTITNSQTNKKHLIQCSFIEIYNQEIHDLLGKDIKSKINLQQTPDGLLIKGLSVHLAKSVTDMEKYMKIGYKNRVIRETSMNKQSSRSHCIFSIRLEESEFDQNGVQKFKVAKLNFVDLAGSERQSKTNLNDEALKQAAKINLSLSALGNVISALVDGKKQHIPYRDSKLTRILNDSLGGNTKTVMIATISPADYNYEETLSTLRYSSRAKFIQNKPIVNQDPKDALLRKYEEEIKRLKLILEGKLPYVRGNQTFYINSQQKELNIFRRFPQLKNEQNQEIMNQISNMNQTQSVGSSEKGDTLINNNNKQIEPNNQPLNEENADNTQLKKQLNFLQQILKKQTNNTPELLQQLHKINDLKTKLNQQALKEEKYKEQQKLREQELLNIQKNYRNLNDEVDSIKQKFNQLKLKYVQTSEQLKDTREAHEKEKEQILQALRIQEAQNNKLMEVLNVIIQPEQLQKLFQKCEWIHDNKQWIVPKFHFSQKFGLTIDNSNSDNFKVIPDKQIDKQLHSLQKASKTMKQTNLIIEQQRHRIEQQRHRNLDKRTSYSQQKLTYQNHLKLQKKAKVQRSQSHRQNLKDLNLFQSQQRKKTFKSSYYSNSNQPRSHQGREGNITTKTEQKRVFEKYKFSLQPLTKLKGQSKCLQIQAPLDLQKIKRQIMNEMKQKNKSGFPISKC